jgi:polyvinyl alcohol dehydrogenase (cytochrome)
VKTRVDDHVVARITGSVKYHDGRGLRADLRALRVQQRQQGLPVLHRARRRGGSSMRTRARNLEDLSRRRPKPWKNAANGAQLYGTGDGGVWNSPTIDPVRGALYVGTGDAVTPPESPLTDAVIALDLKTGKVLWSHPRHRERSVHGRVAGANEAKRARARWARSTTSATRRSS